MKDGYLKLQRRFFTHWLWEEKHSFSKAEAFLDLLQLAAFVPTKRIVSGSLIELEQGELVASVRYLAARWTWGKDKVSTFLQLLEADDIIRRQTRHRETIIILCNYKDYNGAPDSNKDSNKDRGQTVTRQRPDNIEERKERETEREREAGASRPTLVQAKSAAEQIGVTDAKAEEWWNARESTDWMKGTIGGGTIAVGSNWQADLKTYASRNGFSKGQASMTRSEREYPEPPRRLPRL